MSVNSKMTAIADEIRTLRGVAGKMGLDAMATNLDAANTTVDTQADLLNQAIAALEGKVAGGIIPSGIDKIAAGSFTPDSDQTTGQTVYHELGVVPDIAVCWADTGDADVPSGYSGYFLYCICFASNYTQSGSTNNGINSVIYANGSNVTTAIGSAQMRSDYAFFYPSRCAFKTGVTHYWVAVKFE